jgi:hypothetical protein
MYVYAKKLLSILLLSPMKNNLYLFINYDNIISIKVNSGCDERIYSNKSYNYDYDTDNSETSFNDLKDFNDFDDSLNKLNKIRTNFIKKSILDELSNNYTSIYHKISLIDSYVNQKEVPLCNLTSGGLLDDFNFTL